MISGDLRTLMGAAEEFAARELPWALARGNRLIGTERADIVRRYAELTGLSPTYIDRADLRIDLFAFAAELLRDRALQLGRLDLRFTSWLLDANAQKLEDDPSYRALIGPYAAAFNAYIRGELGYQTDLAYNLLTAKVQPWLYKEFEGKSIEVASKLVEAMRANPQMRVHVACGYYDGATPHFAAEHVFAHLRLPSQEASRIEWAYYEAGHMMYVYEPSRLQQSADLAAFVERASS